MGKYQDLIDGLASSQASRTANYQALVEANARALPFLVHALGNHDDAVTREICAEILRDRESPKAIPALVAALRDESLAVREDALWAIESICRYENGGLSDWLGLDPENSKDLYRKVSKWWAKNKQYIEGNKLLG